MRTSPEPCPFTPPPSELLRGPLYYVCVMVVATLVWWRASPVGLLVIGAMCGGDGLADVVGRRMGRSNPLPFNAAKSWAGSCAMLLGSAAFSAALLAVYKAAGALSFDWADVALPVGLVCLAATAVEASPWSTVLDDNLSVPLAAAALSMAML